MHKMRQKCILNLVKVEERVGNGESNTGLIPHVWSVLHNLPISRNKMFIYFFSDACANTQQNKVSIQ